MLKRLMKLNKEDTMSGVLVVDKDLLVTVTEQGYALCFMKDQVPLLSNAGKGVILQKLPKNDTLRVVRSVEKGCKIKVKVKGRGLREIDVSGMTINDRARRGLKLVKRGLPVIGLA